MSLQEKIRTEMMDALKAKDDVRLRVLRGLTAAFTNELVAQKRKPDEKLSDEDALTVIKRAAKQREDSIEQYTKGNRTDLVEQEEAELIVLKTYLPQMLGKEEIRKVAEEKKAELKIEGKSDMGRLMGAIMKELGGNADGKDVKEVVESIL